MKISQMLLREDFYRINDETLDRYYTEKTQNTRLYIYPQLNAIVTAKPSRKVLEYLLCEYSVRNNALKRILTGAYVGLCLSSYGCMSSKKITVHAAIDDNTLIYPCNRKYRIFNFSKNTVEVIPKYGFPQDDLQREIFFRTQNGLPDFVPKLISFTPNRYMEKIIDGRPLARISDDYDIYVNRAYNMFYEYVKDKRRIVSGSKYAEELYALVCKQISVKVRRQETVRCIASKLASVVRMADEIMLLFSHGDLQTGNIWVENKTEKIFIIDWESWGERSIWYDKAVLMEGLRPDGIGSYCKIEKPKEKEACVLLEDLIFQLNELETLPGDFGSDKFDEYLACLEMHMRGKKYGLSCE